MLKCMFVLPVVVILMGYYFHSPLPDNITDPWMLKFIIGGYRVVNVVTKLGSDVGYDTPINISRSLFAQVFKWTSTTVSSQNLKIEDTHIRDIPVRVYTPADRNSKELLPVVVYFHGGGFFTFTVDTYENILREICEETRSVVIAVEYRLAPEYPFPAPLDDCFEVADSVLTDASTFGGDVKRVALADGDYTTVSPDVTCLHVDLASTQTEHYSRKCCLKISEGDSAGGNLAAAVAWRLADKTSAQSRSPPKLQILMYPMLQAIDFQTPSYVEMDGITHEVVGSAGFAMAWSMYCTGKVHNFSMILGNYHVSHELKQSTYSKYLDTSGVEIPNHVPKRTSLEDTTTIDTSFAKEFESCLTNPEFSPLMADSCSKFPKTYIMSVEYDILKDECFLFADRLRQEGVEVHHDYIQGGWHGIMSYTRTHGGQDALDRVIKYVKEHL